MTELLYTEQVVPGRSGYAPVDALTRAWQDGLCTRLWSLGPRIVSLQLSPRVGGGIWKTRERFMTAEPDALLTRLERIGVHHPSSYADCYHRLAPRVRPLPYTLNGLFSWWAGGPWSQARKTGTFRGSWFRYDITSAYRWAATLGLPDPDTYSVVTGPRGDRDGLWVIRLEEYRPDLPSAFAEPGGLAVASSQEIERFNLKCETIRGVTWTRTLPGNYVDETLDKLPCAKESGRAYWGRWIARDPLVCETATGKRWDMRNLHAHFIWGWLIVGRVRLRLWEVAAEAVHVYVDEVVVPHELPTGTVPGSWHLKETMDGVTVHRTGHYGPATRGVIMQTGVSHARRN